MIVKMMILSLFLCGLSPIEAKEPKYFIGSSAFMLGNLDNSYENPRFYQLNLGVAVTPKHTFSLEAITWRYHSPLGVAYGDEMGKPENNFPGFVSAKGLGLAYQYFFLGKLYLALHTTFLKQEYHDKATKNVSTGRQLFVAYRFGRKYLLSNSVFFIEPSIAITHWPINTGLPEAFQKKEDLWPNYSIEPGLHFGMLI